MSELPRASVVVCTRNRAATLASACESLLALDYPAGRWELLIVDNASTDDTQEVARRAARSRPDLVRLVEERELGLSAARNAGVASSTGDVIAFADDDAFPAPRWLRSLVEVMIERDALVVGGPVEPVFEGDLPAWCTDRFIHYIAGWDRGGDVHDLVYNHYPRGNNIAFRRAVFETFGPFSRHLGRIGHTLLSCEETEICLRVERAGGRIVYSPGARIRHLTRTERITPRWMKARFFAQGRSEAILEWMHGGWRGLSLGWRRWQQMYARAASQRTRPPDGEIFARCNRQALLGHTRALVTAPFTVPRYHPASGAAPWLPFQ